MATGFSVGFLWYPAGTSDFVHAFFSTISYHLEEDGWGSKYPYLLKNLCNGKLSWSDAPKAIDEVREIRERLSKIPPSQVTWDIDDLSMKPPWEDNIAPTITNLSNYFVTSSGKDLFDILLIALNNSFDEQIDFEIQTL